MHMGGMGDGEYQVPTQNLISPYLGVLFIWLVILVVSSVFGVISFIAFPEVKITNQPSENRIESFQGNLTTPLFGCFESINTRGTQNR